MLNQPHLIDQRLFRGGFHLVGGKEDTRSTDIKVPKPAPQDVDRVGGCEDSRDSNVDKVAEPPVDNPRG